MSRPFQRVPRKSAAAGEKQTAVGASRLGDRDQEMPSGEIAETVFLKLPAFD